MNKIVAVIVVVLVISFFMLYPTLDLFGDEGGKEYGPTLDSTYEDFSNLKFDDRSVGDKINLTDKVVNASYENNITKVWFESYDEKPILFRGDLRDDWYMLPGSQLSFNVTIVKQNGIQYIKEYSNPTQSRSDVFVVKR